MWSRHFGKPLVPTVFNFGRSGKAPTHPESVDWLAVEFMDRNWDMKAMHRLMVTSNAYKMATSAGEAAAPQTNFRLASCTKQFTAMAIMLLVHDGKLRYDETLTEIFPDFPRYGKTIAVRNLLNHTSGLPDYEDLMDAAEKAKGPIWSPEKQIQDAEVFELLKKETNGKFAPATSWAYSNSGYVVLGLIVAKVSGKSYGEFLRARIFAPLKMNHTIVFQKAKNEVANRAFGHSKEGAALKETDQSSTSATLGDGGVIERVTEGHGLTVIILCNRTDFEPEKLALQVADVMINEQNLRR